VGYTNAGKSTLFNELTNAATFVADQLFATLDSTLRRIELPNYGSAVLADTVGFISGLPHQLIEAFRATLEETASASLLLHVIDYSNEEKDKFIDNVNSVLTEIDARAIPQLQVFNKIDLLGGFEPKIERDKFDKPSKVWISAVEGAGIDLLRKAIAEILAGSVVSEKIRLAPNLTRLRSQIFSKGFVEEEHIDEEGYYHLRVRLPNAELERLTHQGAIIEAGPIVVSSKNAEKLEMGEALVG
jgi:GTP-binding protein HflX